ncbi:aspartate kinase [Candidatus Tremblaya phenacola PAVE]|nr:aspartate kinase [Candidatus Tremblaya phenacola PAVE]
MSFINQTDGRPEHLGPVDLTISVGERISIGLLSVALWKAGRANISFDGQQAGICTEGPNTNSAIRFINPKALRKGQFLQDVLVVTGFQGASLESITATLGRGGSDTSAAALSTIMGLSCPIFTDVMGIRTADPKAGSQTRIVGKMTFEEAYGMACCGSKVLHSRSLFLAGKYSIGMSIVSSQNRSKNRKAHTNVLFSFATLRAVEKPTVTSISYRKGRTLVQLQAGPHHNSCSIMLSKLTNLRPFYFTAVSQFSSNSRPNLSLACDQHQTQEAENLVLKEVRKRLPIKSKQQDNRISELSVIGLGLGHQKLVGSILVGSGTKFKNITSSDMRLTLQLSKQELPNAIRKLHYHFF